MNFSLSEEQVQLQDSLHRLVGEVCPALEVHRLIDAEAGFDVKLWRSLLDFGIGALLVDEGQGGLGLEMIDAALVAEVLGYHAAPVPYLGHLLAIIALRQCGNEAIKAKWLPKLIDGSVLGTVALCEGEGDWLPTQWRMAQRDEAASGTKTFVPAAMEASIAVVGLEGGTLGLVELESAAVVREPVDGVDRTRRMGTLHFSNAAVLAIDATAATAADLIDAALVLLAADSFGGARRALDMAVGYASEREQFGVTISSFQALRHQLANIALEVEPCRGLYWYAAHAFDHRRDELSANAALAKAHIAERFLQAARDAVEAHGGIGFTWEYDIHVWLKRAMFNWAWAGVPAVHRERFARLSAW